MKTFLALCMMLAVGVVTGCDREWNGGKYRGGWKDGKPNGKGTLTISPRMRWSSSDGTKYSGESQYVGEFKDGKPNGQGTWTMPDGTKFGSEFKNGMHNGQGTWTKPDGSKYVGEVKDGRKHGQGTLTNPDGTTQSGLWKNDEYLGPATNAPTTSGADKNP